MQAVESRAQIIETLDLAYQGRISNVRHSLAMAQEMLGLAREIKDPGLIGQCLNHVSLYYMIVGENERSIEASREAINCFLALDDEKGIADAKFNIGSVYYKTDNYHSGLIHLVDALAIYKKFNDYAKESRVHKALGTIYEFFGDERSALTSYHHAIDAARKVGDLNLESNAYNPLSGIYLNQNQIEKATELIEQSIEIKSRTQDVRGLAFALYGRGKIHTQTKRYAEAEADFREAERIHEEMGEKLGLAMVYYKLGVLYTVMNKPKEALGVLLKGRAFSIQHHISQFNYKCDFQLYQVYKQLGDIHQSMKYLEEHLKVKDAVINIETLKVIENYELISKQQLLENIELQQAKEHAEIQNQALLKANAELDQFVYHASHDLRAPLASIIGLVDLGLKTTDPREARQCFELINDRARAQDHFIREIVEHTRNARLSPEWTDIPLRAFVTESIESLHFMEGTDKLQIEIVIDPAWVIRSDSSRLKSIINNLVSNAIKYQDKRKPNPYIRIEGWRTETEVILTIRDNGIGIIADRQHKIFDMFYRGTELSHGSGLGLFIVKEIVQTLGGTIDFESSQGVGSVFTVKLPVV